VRHEENADARHGQRTVYHERHETSTVGTKNTKENNLIFFVTFVPLCFRAFRGVFMRASVDARIERALARARAASTAGCRAPGEDVAGPAAARSRISSVAANTARAGRAAASDPGCLDAVVRPDPLPRLVERRAPVGADHVAARVAQLVEDRSVPTPKWIVGTPHGFTRSKIFFVWGRMNSR